MNVRSLLNGEEQFTPTVVNKFLQLWMDYLPPHHLIPKNPQETLKKLLKAALKEPHYLSYYYTSNEWVYEIEDNEVIDIFRLPPLTYHAILRIAQRLGWSTNNKVILKLRLAYEMRHGRVLSQEDRRKKQIGKTVNAVSFEDRIYILSKQNSLITVVHC